jgi:hypothetical protein
MAAGDEIIWATPVNGPLANLRRKTGAETKTYIKALKSHDSRSDFGLSQCWISRIFRRFDGRFRVMWASDSGFCAQRRRVGRRALPPPAILG